MIRLQSWIFIGRTDAEAETPIPCLPDAKNWLIWKDPDAGKDWRQEKWKTEDEMVGCHHWLDGHEFEQAPGFGDGQGSLVCCSPWGCKDSDTTEWLNWTTSGTVIKTLGKGGSEGQAIFPLLSQYSHLQRDKQSLVLWIWEALTFWSFLPCMLEVPWGGSSKRRWQVRNLFLLLVNILKLQRLL